MFFERIYTQGLAHYSYMIGDGNEAIVIDPRIDIEIYLEKARESGMTIKAILETHRNEDYVIGSRKLAKATGAKVYISQHEDLGYKYGTDIKDGDTLDIGNLKIKAIHTPGHTLGHMSYALYLDSNKPYMIFTGDLVFAGETGRTDFYGEGKLDKMTGLLYDSIFNKVLPLGDHVILCPAHGSGSACGSSIEDRPYTTIGYERKFNKNLQHDSKEEFIKNVKKVMGKSPYFNRIEELNIEGVLETDKYNSFLPIDSQELVSKIESSKTKDKKEQVYIIDVRNEGDFSSSYIPNSIYIPKDSLASHLGWLVPVDSPIYFVTDTQGEEVLKELYLTGIRMGYTNILGFLSGGISTWQTSNNELENIETTTPKELYKELEHKKDFVILDVRDEEELEDEGKIEDSINIPLHELIDKIDELPKGKSIYSLCSSGSRATIAASLVKRTGENSKIILGGMQAWNEYTS